MISFDIKDLAAVAGSLRRRFHASPVPCVAGFMRRRFHASPVPLELGLVKLGVIQPWRYQKQGLIKTESDQNRV